MSIPLAGESCCVVAISFPVREPVNKKDPYPHPIHQNTIKESPKNPEEQVIIARKRSTR